MLSHEEKLTSHQLRISKLQGITEVIPCSEWENTRWLADDEDKTRMPPKRPKCKGLKDDFN